jgi:hypothetical protein
LFKRDGDILHRINYPLDFWSSVNYIKVKEKTIWAFQDLQNRWMFKSW